MLTGAEEVEIHALRAKGWSISAIARHLDRDRGTIRDYLNAETTPGIRKSSRPDVFALYVPYLTERFDEDPHVWATVLYDEIAALGYGQSYQTFTRHLRERGLRPHCEACEGVSGRATIEIEHPPGEEIQWDWDELGAAPWGGTAHLLVGTLSYSSKARAVFAESEAQPDLVAAIDAVLRRFGGTARRWRVDRMATVIVPGTADIQPSFVPVAKHYRVGVDPCPPRAANRKGVVEKSIHYLTQRWWRSADVSTMGDAQASLDRFCETVADARTRPPARLPEGERFDTDGNPRRPTVAELAAREPLLELPAAPYPATLSRDAIVSRSALVAFEANQYAVAPGMIGHTVTVTHRLGTNTVEIISAAGAVLESHPRQRPGLGVIYRPAEHKAALEGVVLAQFPKHRPCPTKPNRPPGEAAKAEAQKLLARMDSHGDVVVDLDAYERLATSDQQEGA
ncbi:MAG: transcriptional regulator [Dehalococcoidia bacterium]|nr:transcriptional regulator [Dehalococcoidia bacterium]